MVKATDAARTSANAAKSAAETSAVQLEAAERPWITINPTQVGPLIIDQNGLRVTMQFVITNSGHSPAIGIWIDPEIYLGGSKKPDPQSERIQLCKELLKQSPVIGETVFPGTGKPREYTFGTSSQELERAGSEYRGLLPGSVIACIAYSPTFIKGRRYFTGVIYELLGADSRGMPSIISKDQIGPSLKLVLMDSPIYGTLAQ